MCIFGSVSVQAEQLFDYIGFKAGNLGALPRWKRVLDKLEYERGVYSRCDADIKQCKTPALVSWRAFVAEQKGLPPRAQLSAVNRFVNRWPYVTDDVLWGRSDYWATPLEFIENSGDCEDYAILKYVTLRSLGFAPDDVRIAVVQDTVRNIAHAILIADEGGQRYVLDSLFTAVLEQGRLMQYAPYYTVNENARWTYVSPLGHTARKFAR
ncbi:MAG: transglutaminase-like cysteine peptidase [Alphaproteobacteria bacterium]